MAADPDLDHEMLIRHLIEHVRCAECDSAYRAEDVYVIGREDDAWTLVAFCPVCGTESVVLAYLDEIDTTDAAPPDEEEVAAWRRFLAAFDGDLHDLLDR